MNNKTVSACNQYQKWTELTLILQDTKQDQKKYLMQFLRKLGVQNMYQSANFDILECYIMAS